MLQKISFSSSYVEEKWGKKTYHNHWTLQAKRKKQPSTIIWIQVAQVLILNHPLYFKVNLDIALIWLNFPLFILWILLQGEIFKSQCKCFLQLN